MRTPIIGACLSAGMAMELQGCAFNVVCRNQTWRRPQDVLTAAQVR